MTSVAFNKPDLVLCAAGMSDGRVMVIASTDLHRAALTVEMYAPPGICTRGEPTAITLHTRMGSYRIAYGATYAEAIARLFEDWPDPEQLELAEPPRELGVSRRMSAQ